MCPKGRYITLFYVIALQRSNIRGTDREKCINSHVTLSCLSFCIAIQQDKPMQCIARLSLIMEKNVKKCHCIKNIVYSGLFLCSFQHQMDRVSILKIFYHCTISSIILYDKLVSVFITLIIRIFSSAHYCNNSYIYICIYIYS